MAEPTRSQKYQTHKLMCALYTHSIFCMAWGMFDNIASMPASLLRRVGNG